MEGVNNFPPTPTAGHGNGSIAGIPNCSAGYWVLTFLPFPICVAVTLWVGRKLRAQHKLKVDCGYEFQPGAVQARLVV